LVTMELARVAFGTMTMLLGIVVREELGDCSRVTVHENGGIGFPYPRGKGLTHWDLQIADGRAGDCPANMFGNERRAERVRSIPGLARAY